MSAFMQSLLILGTALGGIGTYLLLPKGTRSNKMSSAAALLSGLFVLWLIWAATAKNPGFGTGLVFGLLATGTVLSAIMVVTRANPVYSALWFTSTIIGTSGLFLQQNAQFLAVATVIVYAGAIVVMFLFVVMLAQRQSIARFDRLARDPQLATSTCFLLLGILAFAIVDSYANSASPLLPVTVSDASVAQRAATPQASALGTKLFTVHWIGLEVAGTILFVAMVAAIVISARRLPVEASAGQEAAQ